MSGFAANSLLCRLALAPGLIDAASFTTIRMCAGAATLGLLVRGSVSAGSWSSALALFAYAILFSFAYLRIGAAVGALLLFGAVQITMVGVGLRTGERPRPVEWIGLAVALLGLVALTAPGLSAPDAVGCGLMVAAGIAWGIYSLRGRRAGDPLRTTAGNFLRTVPLVLATSLLLMDQTHLSPMGMVYAVASGALASGVGYSLWYAALRGLTATRAAIAQLAVPVIAALAAVPLLHESITWRLMLAGSAILVGVGLACLSPKR
ncbi:MAG TPA: EamA family transporter [Planctomycetota bacterium]|nr:EamA family transporter [Planctomycetota bacterium]